MPGTYKPSPTVPGTPGSTVPQRQPCGLPPHGKGPMCYIEPSRQNGNLVQLSGRNLPIWELPGRRPPSSEAASRRPPLTGTIRSTVDRSCLGQVQLQNVHAQHPLRAGTLPAVHHPVPERPPEGGSRLVAVVNADAQPPDAAPEVPVRQRPCRLASQPLPMDVRP